MDSWAIQQFIAVPDMRLDAIQSAYRLQTKTVKLTCTVRLSKLSSYVDSITDELIGWSRHSNLTGNDDVFRPRDGCSLITVYIDIQRQLIMICTQIQLNSKSM